VFDQKIGAARGGVSPSEIPKNDDLILGKVGGVDKGYPYVFLLFPQLFYLQTYPDNRLSLDGNDRHAFKGIIESMRLCHR
jgi:hypothetical protein